MTTTKQQQDEDEIGVDVIEMWYEDKIVMYDPKTRDLYDNISGEPIGKLPLDVVWWKTKNPILEEQEQEEDWEDGWLNVEEVMWNGKLYYHNEANGDIHDEFSSEKVGTMNREGVVVLF